MSKVIRIIGLAVGEPSEFDGQYLQSYDPHAHWADGSYDGGIIETTADASKAARYPDAGAALAAWKAGPDCRCHGMRMDGRPNRPLTAFTVSVEDAPSP